MGSYWYTVCATCNEYTESLLKSDDKPICQKCFENNTLIVKESDIKEEPKKKQEEKKSEEVNLHTSCKLQCLKCMKYKDYSTEYLKSKIQCNECVEKLITKVDI